MSARPMRDPARYPRNRLLGALAPADWQRVAGALTGWTFEAHAPLYTAGEPIASVYFIESGMASATVTGLTGDTVEVAATGCEGFVSVAAALGFDAAPVDVCYQIPGDALAMPIDVFRRELAAGVALCRSVMMYVRAHHVQVMQTAFCNRQHTIAQRLARWLLMAQDSSGADAFPLTHEVISEMLGVHRPAVTVTAHALQRAGLIRYRRGIVTICDRNGLERVSCGCYAAVRSQVDTLLPTRAA